GETGLPHGTAATAMPLGVLPGLSVPNTLRPGDLNYGTIASPNTFAVGAESVSGQISAAGEKDVYSFTGAVGQKLTFEVMSRTLKRIGASGIDTVLRLYDEAGNLLALNDNDIESRDSHIVDFV